MEQKRNCQKRTKKIDRPSKMRISINDLRVLGMVEKRWGKLMCAHGYEGATSLVELPDFPQK